MKARLFLSIGALLLGLALLAGPALARSTAAASSDGYVMGAWVVAGGGGSSQNGAYTLAGTIGQSEAAPALSNGPYAVRGGFWQAAFPDWRTYVPVIKK